MKKTIVALLACVAMPVQADEPKDIVQTYANIAHAMYSDALAAAITLDGATKNLTASPSELSLQAARAAWLNARVPYQQTEVFRFGNPLVDEWEGKVNAWPLDEGLIDYVAPAYGKQSESNPYYTANVIANPNLKIGGKMIDASSITPALLSETLHELDGVEANVATGYHAIEFLLWGQDLNGSGPGAGDRAHTDFDRINCTHGNCDRRGEYLVAASELLVSDLHEMVNDWAPGGAARVHVTSDPNTGLAAMIQGLGSLSYGELAGERMKLGLMLHDPEEEHDCFSDNTHNSHFYDEVGMLAVYQGRYVRIDGRVVEGASLKSRITELAPAIAAKIDVAMANAYNKLLELKVQADTRQMAYDQMLGKGNAAGNALVQSAVDGLVAQAKSIELAMVPLGISAMAFEGSESLDQPAAVFK